MTNEEMNLEDNEYYYSETDRESDRESEEEYNIDEEGLIYEEKMLNDQKNLLYRELADIIADREKTDKQKLETISKKFVTNPEKFYESLIDSKLPNDKLSNSLQNKYRFLYHALAMAIKFELHLTVKFLLTFPEIYLTSRKITDSNSKSIAFLKDRERSGKAKDIGFFSSVKSAIFGLNLRYCHPLIVLAVKSKNKEMVKLLVQEGADLNIISTRPRTTISTLGPITALGQAIHIGSLELFNFLISYPEIDLTGTLLHLHLDDIDQQGKYFEKRKNLIKKLLEKIGNFKVYDEHGYNLMHRFFEIYNHSWILDVLFKKDNENINTKTSSGNSFLHIGMTKDFNFRGSVRSLLDHGIDINAQNEDGNTALHFLIGKNTNTTTDFREKLEYLLVNGANQAIKNNLGETILDIASEEAKQIIQRFNFFDNIKNIMTDKDKDERNKIDLIIEKYNHNPRLFQKIFFGLPFEQRLNPDYIWLALSLSIKNNFYHLTKFLLSMSDSIPQMEVKKEILREQFLQITSLSSQREKPLLDLAIETDMTGAMVELLINYGCDINGHLEKPTALETAIFHNNIEAVNKILAHKSIDLKTNLIGFFPKKSLTPIETTIFSELLTRLQDLPEKKRKEIEKNLVYQAAGLCQNSLSIEIFLSKTEPDLERKSSLCIFYSSNKINPIYDRFQLDFGKEAVTPLHIAFSEGSVETVRALLEFGAVANSRSALTSSTPFDYAIRRVIPKKILSNKDYGRIDLAIFQKLEETNFREKTKLLLKTFGTTYSDNYGRDNSKDFFDQEDIMRNYPSFWQRFDLMMQSIIDEIEQEKSVDVSPNNIELKIGHIDDRDSEQGPTKRQRC